MSPGISVSQLWQFPLGDELVVARHDIQGLFLLNRTARFVWEESNGGAAPEDIAQNLAVRYGVPEALAMRDVAETLVSWSQGLLSPTPVSGAAHRPGLFVPAQFDSDTDAVEINCLLNGRGFRVLLESRDLVEEIAPRLAQAAVPRLPPGAPFLTFALANGDDRVYVFRDGVCIAEEEKTSGARAILLQEIATHCDPYRETKAVLHAGACGTDSGCVILAGASHAGKSTLCAALMSEGFYCYADDSAVLDPEFRVAGMPFPLMLRESSWPVLNSRIPSFSHGASIHERWGCKVRFLPSNLPANCSPAVVPAALVFIDYRPGALTRLQPLTPFEALVALQQGGFWVEHDPETIGGFLAWIARLDRFQLTYSAIDEASQAICGLLRPENFDRSLLTPAPKGTIQETASPAS